MDKISLIMKNHINDVENFINYSIGNGNITKDTTIEEFLNIIQQIKEYYIPICESVENYIIQNIDKTNL
jgi:hypothetical protein